MKNLFTIMAIVELVAGLALLGTPSLVSSILLGTPLESAPGLIVARIAGAGLLSLGIACWFARGEEPNAAAKLIVAMLVYNAAGAIVLAYARVGYGLGSAILWPAVLIHALLAVWCAISIRQRP